MRQKTLSELEKEVMDYIWRTKRCSVAEIHAYMKERFAYTTLATIVQRLQVKGMVFRKKNQKEFLYYPKISQLQYSTRIAQNFVTSFFSSYGDAALASFAESIDKLPKDKRERLLNLLKHDNKNT
jgi:predicted transcriptional regulator